MPNRKLAGLVIVAMILIELGTVASHWGDVLARRPDFAAFYRAAQQMRTKGSGPIQQASPESRVISHADDAEEGGMSADTLHPPFEMVLFLPLSYLEYRTAYVVWLLCNLAMLWAVPILLWQELSHLQRDLHFIAIAYGSMFSVLVCLVQGQDAILLLLLLALSYRMLKRNKDSWAGILLALALFKFQIVIPIAFFMVVQRNWKVLKGFAGVGLALLLSSIALIGWKGFVHYFTAVSSAGLANSNAGADNPALMPNLRGLLLSTAGKFTSLDMVKVLVAVISIVIVGFTIVWLRKNRNIDLRYSFALIVAVSAVISYHFFPHNACILLLPLLLLAADISSPERDTTWKWLLSLTILTIYLAPNLFSLKAAMPVVAAASLSLVCLLLALRSTRVMQPDASDALSSPLSQ